MSAEKIWTAGDFEPALEKARANSDEFAVRGLLAHGIHADHCDGWEVAAWPCTPALGILRRLYPEPGKRADARLAHALGLIHGELHDRLDVVDADPEQGYLIIRGTASKGGGEPRRYRLTLTIEQEET